MQVIPEYGVYADVSLIIDASDVDDSDASIDVFEAAYDDQWNVLSQAVFVTAVPTKLPSFAPTTAPTTPQPSAMPSITGLVVTLEVKIFFQNISCF